MAISEARKGVLAMVAATVVWGLSGLYFKALAAVPPLEMLSHRTLWSVVFLGVVLMLQRGGGELVALASQPRLVGWLAVSAALIAVNWLLFIHSVQAGQALEASLGYYVFPLCAVGLGYLVLGERFTAVQRLAIALAASAVALLAFGLGAAPWVALTLAATFSLYGLIKTRVPKGSVLTVVVETMILAPAAAVWLSGMHRLGWHDIDGRTGGVFGHDLGSSLLLVCAGVLTGGPLLLFSYAAQRIPYSTVGLVQYLNPTLQFAVAVAVFGERFTLWHAVAFPLIWLALGLYSWESLRPAGGSGAGAAAAGRGAR
jgi:chloramphenicol-sensitive protein RarD